MIMGPDFAAPDPSLCQPAWQTKNAGLSCGIGNTLRMAEWSMYPLPLLEYKEPCWDTISTPRT
jgi:hypothetical protein